MSIREFQVPNMLGETDVSIVENGLRQLRGVTAVQINAGTKHIQVEWDDPATWRDIDRALDELGYPIETE